MVMYVFNIKEVQIRYSKLIVRASQSHQNSHWKEEQDKWNPNGTVGINCFQRESRRFRSILNLGIYL